MVFVQIDSSDLRIALYLILIECDLAKAGLTLLPFKLKTLGQHQLFSAVGFLLHTAVLGINNAEILTFIALFLLIPVMRSERRQAAVSSA